MILKRPEREIRPGAESPAGVEYGSLKVYVLVLKPIGVRKEWNHSMESQN
jgi:hypothetical protein